MRDCFLNERESDLYGKLTQSLESRAQYVSYKLVGLNICGLE